MGYPTEAYKFRVPSQLTISEHGAKNALLTGSCTVINLEGVLKQEYGLSCYTTHINALETLNWNSLPQDLDFQVISLPMDRLLPRYLYLRDDFNNLATAQMRFQHASSLISELLDQAMTLNRERGLLTFVYNLLVPQQNPQGRLLPRYDLRNRVYFIEELNKVIHGIAAAHQNAYVIDVDAIAATFGKMRCQDDSVWAISHGGAFSNLDYDLDQRLAEAGHLRLERVPRIENAIDADMGLFWLATAHEVMATYRTVMQRDQVKLVVVDLDDTLWRGLAVDPALESGLDLLEGQPFGVIEALAYLKARGIALAVVSKNDHDRVMEAWKQLLGNQFSVENFVALKVNWRSKADNIVEIANDLNVGLNSVVFVDDNPREREEVARSLPEVRVIGGEYYNVRRDLLWSPETQLRSITAESARKTEMFKKQIEREQTRRTIPRAEFLAELNLRVRRIKISARSHPTYARAIELVNKTNQFNTTGVRWSDSDLEHLFTGGGYVMAFAAADRTADYGVVAVAVVCKGDIRIFVMSCRVIGLDVEIAAIALIEEMERENGAAVMKSRTIETERNTLSRDLFARAGYTEQDGVWRRSLVTPIPVAEHIVLLRD